MKRQILLIAASLSLLFFSCRKDDVGFKKANTDAVETSSTSAISGSTIYFNPLLVKLDAWYPFNGNLNEVTGKLGPGVSFGTAPQYSVDHKGHANSALLLNGTSFVKLFNVPQQTASSISVWVRTLDLGQNLGIVSGNAQGLAMVQNPNKYVAALTLVSNGFSISSVTYKEVFNLNWHHLALTYDGSSFKFYYDGALASSSALAGSIATALTTYILGNGYWKGALDDLRFYSRTLSAADVQSLYSL